MIGLERPFSNERGWALNDCLSEPLDLDGIELCSTEQRT